MNYALGIDLGGTRIKTAALAADGQVIDQRLSATIEGDLAGAVKLAVELLIAERGKPAWIGVAAPGIAASDAKSIWWMEGRLAGLVGLEWSRVLNFRPVPVINDAQAALMGEMAVGAARDCRNVAMLTLGTGVGGAVVCDGQLLHGALGRAGHLGHLTVDADGPLDITQCPGSLEYAIGNYSLPRRTGGRFPSTQALLDAMNAGDPAAREIWLASIKRLAAAIVSIINVVDPELVIIGGGIARSGELLFEPLRLHLDQFEWRPHGRAVRIVPATSGEYAGAIGAAFYAMRFPDEKDSS